MRKIIFFGDSLTAGYGLKHPENESISALISDRLKAEGLNYEVVNAGINGDTSRSALSRLDAVLNGGLAGFVLELGANDFLRGHLPTEVSGNLQKIITTVRLAYPNAWILLLGIELPIWAHSVYGAGYAKIFYDLAKANSVFLVPSFLEGVSGQRSLNMPDGVHPLAAGYKRATDNIWPILLNILKQQSSWLSSI